MENLKVDSEGFSALKGMSESGVKSKFKGFDNSRL